MVAIPFRGRDNETGDAQLSLYQKASGDDNWSKTQTSEDVLTWLRIGSKLFFHKLISICPSTRPKVTANYENGPAPKTAAADSSLSLPSILLLK